MLLRTTLLVLQDLAATMYPCKRILWLITDWPHRWAGQSPAEATAVQQIGASAFDKLDLK